MVVLGILAQEPSIYSALTASEGFSYMKPKMQIENYRIHDDFSRLFQEGRIMFQLTTIAILNGHQQHEHKESTKNT